MRTHTRTPQFFLQPSAALLYPYLEGGDNAGWVPLSLALLWCSPIGHMLLLPVSYYAGASKAAVRCELSRNVMTSFSEIPPQLLTSVVERQSVFCILAFQPGLQVIAGRHDDRC